MAILLSSICMRIIYSSLLEFVILIFFAIENFYSTFSSIDMNKNIWYLFPQWIFQSKTLLVLINQSININICKYRLNQGKGCSSFISKCTIVHIFVSLSELLDSEERYNYNWWKESRYCSVGTVKSSSVCEG